MRLSPHRIVATSTVVAALALAACAGHGVVPAGDSFAPSALSAGAAKTPAPKKTPNPCTKGATQSPWVFGGACAIGALSNKAGTTAKMPTYDAITVQAVFSANNAKPGTELLVRDATGKSDVTGKFAGKLMPAFNTVGSPPQTNTVSPLVYLKVHNEGAAFQFQGIPQITITVKSPFPKGTVCFLTQMNISNYTWVQNPVLPSSIKGNVITFGTLTNQVSVPKNGTIYIAAACHY
jgi:hypothetical protein